jgi:hypothetical protein
MIAGVIALAQRQIFVASDGIPIAKLIANLIAILIAQQIAPMSDSILDSK